MDLVSNDYEHVVAPHTSDFVDLPIYNLTTFHNNHVLPPLKTETDNLYHRICHALSTIPFCEEFVFAQFWAAICFGTCTVLTTRGQPYGLSVYTDGFRSYHMACSDHNSYVYHKEPEQIVCIGVPARVFINCSPEWTRDVSLYNDKVYPQLQDALRCDIQGSLAMPVIEGRQCIGVVEIVMANGKDNYCYEMAQVCRAFEEVGLQSSERTGNVKIGTYEHHPNIRRRKTSSSSITRNDLTKIFGLPKAKAAEMCELKEGAFTALHQRFGIQEWPCKAQRIVKAPAHLALINGSASSTISRNDRLGTYEHRPDIRKRKTLSSSITRNDLAKLFGLPKDVAAKMCKLEEGAFTDLYQIYGIKEWPCKAREIVKASAHLALINGSASNTISDHKDLPVIKDLDYRLMQDDVDMNCEGDAVECMDH